MRQPAFVLIITKVCLTASCAVHEVRVEPPTEKVPEEYSQSGYVEAPSHWWRAFNDPTLNQVMQQALHGNLDLESAWARLRQSIAVAKQAGADLYPSLSLNPTLSHSHTETPQGNFDTDQIRLSLSAAYEVDLWKRIASQQRAAQLDAQAQVEALQSTALTLSSQVAKTWFQVVEQYEQLALLTEQERTSQEFLELNELRFGQGLATAVDVFQQRSQLATTQAQFPQARELLEVSQNRLNVLLGQDPQRQRWEEQTYPPLPSLPQTGVPLHLIKNRPDIRDAWRRVMAADYRVGAAIADRFPALSISGNAGVDGDQISDVFRNFFWNVVGNFFQPLIDGGFRRAEVERTRAVLNQRLKDYEQTVLLSIEDVENALIREQQQREFLRRLQHEIDMNAATLRESRNRFINGLDDFLPVLTALQAVQRLERTQITARRQLLEHRVDLYVALGGNWTQTWYENQVPAQMHAQGE